MSNFLNLQESERFKMLSHFKHEFLVKSNPGNQLLCVPNFMSRVALEIANAKDIPLNLAIFGLIPSLAAADRGRTRIVLSDESSLSLSLIMNIGVNKSVGKTRSIEEEIKIFNEWKKINDINIKNINKQRKKENSILNEKIKYLKRMFHKTGNALLLDEADHLESLKQKEIPIQDILLGDVTDTAYTQYLVENGYAIRLESDGIMLPKKTLRVLTKAWSRENISRKRTSTVDGYVTDPFIVELVMTQPEFFSTYINTPDYINSGLITRTLIYCYNYEYISLGPTRKVNEEILNKLREKLFSLLDASNYYEIDDREYRYIRLSEEAEKHLDQFVTNLKLQANPGNPLYHAKEFINRIKEHAIRIAGCFYLAEYPEDSKDPIPLEIVQMATDLCQFFLNQELRWIIGDYQQETAECCRAIMINILEKNYNFVPEAMIKRTLKGRYKAADINVALYYLLNKNFLYEYKESIDLFSHVKKGRPSGRLFVNPFYEPNGIQL